MINMNSLVDWEETQLIEHMLALGKRFIDHVPDRVGIAVLGVQPSVFGAHHPSMLVHRAAAVVPRALHHRHLAYIGLVISRHRQAVLPILTGQAFDCVCDLSTFAASALQAHCCTWKALANSGLKLDPACVTVNPALNVEDTLVGVGEGGKGQNTEG